MGLFTKLMFDKDNEELDCFIFELGDTGEIEKKLHKLIQTHPNNDNLRDNVKYVAWFLDAIGFLNDSDLLDEKLAAFGYA